MTGAELIAKERQRQIEEEGWTAEHDDEHPIGHLALAGVCYALDTAGIITHDGATWQKMYLETSKLIWPWDEKWWKPTPQDPIRQLTKAGALIAAEIDKLQRQKGKGVCQNLNSHHACTLMSSP